MSRDRLDRLARRAFALLLALAPLARAQEPEPAPPGRPPNIVVLMADDLGWPDLGWSGARFHTPHIDRLAASGLRLTSLYTEPSCSPSRAALLTGRYPHRYGLAGRNVAVFAERGLARGERLLPERLRELGYATAISGKWHLGHRSLREIPTARGFERQYGHYTGMIDYDSHLWAGRVLDWYRDGEPLVEPGYSTDLIAAEACRILREHPRERPLFLYVAFNAPHEPYDPPPRHRERYAHIQDPCLATYAAMVSCLDDGVGRVLATLEELGMSGNTLVCFLSDNGAPLFEGFLDNFPLRGGKGGVYEGGVRVPASLSWPGVLPAGEVYATPLHLVDLCATFLGVAGAAPAEAPALDGRDHWRHIFWGEPAAPQEIALSIGGRSEGIRQGRWKLVRTGRSVELFDLESDPFERADLAAQRPLVREGLLARLEARAAESVAPPRWIEARQLHPLPESWAPTQDEEPLEQEGGGARQPSEASGTRSK